MRRTACTHVVKKATFVSISQHATIKTVSFGHYALTHSPPLVPAVVRRKHMRLISTSLTEERTTYMAGCTDPEYGDSSCPHKDNSGQQLLGLVQCSGSQVDGTALWSACPGPTTKTALGAPSQCSCSGTTAGLLWMTTSLSALATLPTAIEETIMFNDGHYPTVKTTASRVSTFVSSSGIGGVSSTTNGSSATAAPTASGSPAAAGNSTTSGSLSTGAEVGIGIGATLMGLCAIGLAISAFPVYRRRLRGSKGKDPSFTIATAEEENNNNMMAQQDNASQILHYPHYRPSTSPGSTIVGGSNMPDGDSHTYTGYKSELPADPPHAYSYNRSELPADEVSPPPTTTQLHTDLVSPLSPCSLNLTDRQRLISEASSFRLPASSSPRSQFTGWHEGGGVQERTGSDGAMLEPISELHG